MNRYRTLLITILVIVGSLAPTSATLGEQKKIAKEATAAPSPTKKRPSRTTGGLFFGHIYDIAKEEMVITVRPVDRKLPRKRFFIDRKTEIRKSRKKLRFESLKLGEKIAVRFLQRDGLAFADAIFLVEGEFVKQDYLPKKLARPKAEAKEGGGHGEGDKKEEKKEEKKPEKKAEKKSGGH